MAKLEGAVEARRDRGAQWKCVLTFPAVADAELARFLFHGPSGGGTRPPYKLRGLPRGLSNQVMQILRFGVPAQASWFSPEELAKFKEFFRGATGRGSYALDEAHSMMAASFREGPTTQARFVFWEIGNSHPQ